MIGLWLAAHVCVSAAQAADFCADITAQVESAQSNFVQSDGERSLRSSRNEAGTCGLITSELGAVTHHCHWEFALRHVAAQATFDAFDQELKSCFGSYAKIIKDQNVNHPDFYDKNTYWLNDVSITLSLKDKNALGKTFVFVGVHGATARQ